MNKVSLLDAYPDIAAEADGWDPSLVTPGSNKAMKWRCGLGHLWTATVANRTRGNGCSVCRGRTVLAGFNDLQSQLPDIAQQADGWDPSKVHFGSNKKMPWIDQYGHTWEAPVYARRGGGGCPVCVNRKLLRGFNDVATTHPDIAAQADGWDPTTVITGTAQVFMWVCTQGHHWEAKVSNRITGSGCHICAGTVVQAGTNDLATLFPEVAAQADGWDPTSVTAHSRKSLKWRCDLGHSWTSDVSHRVDGSGCPSCTNRRLEKGFNDLATTHPELAAEADGWDPSCVLFGSAKVMKWICSLGHSWEVSVSERTKKNSGCPYCYGRYTWPGFNDLATTHPELAAEADGWDPTKVSFGSSKKLNWKCIEGHSWTATVGSRTRLDASNCPSCAKSGFSPERPAWLYFLRHDAWNMQQIGITNEPEVRLAKHKRSGWEVIEVRGPMPGEVTRKWERSILEALSDKSIKRASTLIAGRFDGYTEAWGVDEYQAFSIRELMEIVFEMEEEKRPSKDCLFQFKLRRIPEEKK